MSTRLSRHSAPSKLWWPGIQKRHQEFVEKDVEELHTSNIISSLKRFSVLIQPWLQKVTTKYSCKRWSRISLLILKARSMMHHTLVRRGLHRSSLPTTLTWQSLETSFLLEKRLRSALLDIRWRRWSWMRRRNSSMFGCMKLMKIFNHLLRPLVNASSFKMHGLATKPALTLEQRISFKRLSKFTCWLCWIKTCLTILSMIWFQPSLLLILMRLFHRRSRTHFRTLMIWSRLLVIIKYLNAIHQWEEIMLSLLAREILMITK